MYELVQAPSLRASEEGRAAGRMAGEARVQQAVEPAIEGHVEARMWMDDAQRP